MTIFKSAAIMFALILATAACAKDDPLPSDTASGSTAATQDEAAHETGDAHDDGDAHEAGEADEDGDAHEAGEADDGDAHDDMVMEGDAHDDGDAHETGEADDGDAHDDMVMEDAHGEVAPSEADIAAADRSIEITMSEFAFTPVPLEVSAGETIEFVATNEGAIEHEFRLSNDHRVEEHIAAGHEDHGDEGGHHEQGDRVVLVQPGETASLVVAFTGDTTVFTNIVCLIPDHFEAGMHGELDYAA